MSAAPPPVQIPPDGDTNRGPHLLAIFWTQIAVSGIFVALKFYVKRCLRSTGLEDWTMLICLVFYVASFSLATVAVHHGMGRHVYYLHYHGHSLPEFLQWHRVIPPFCFMSILFGKISVSLLLLRIMGPKAVWRKWFLYGNMILFTLIMVLSSILGFVQCNPPRALWKTVPGAKCWKPESQLGWSIFRSSYSSFLDFALALLPISIVWNLQMSNERKIGFCVLLGAGILSGICAALKTSLWKSQAVKEDMTFGVYGLYAWTSSELSLNIVCGTIPTLNPLYYRIFKGRPIGESKKFVSTKENAFRMKPREDFSGKRKDKTYKVDSQASTVAERSCNSTDDKIYIFRSFDVESQLVNEQAWEGVR